MTTLLLPSRTGAMFVCQVETDPSDGALTIISADGRGYRSAHRDYAAEHFEHVALWNMNRLSWVNASGVRVVLTRWHTQAFRRLPASEVLAMRSAYLDEMLDGESQK